MSKHPKLKKFLKIGFWTLTAAVYALSAFAAYYYFAEPEFGCATADNVQIVRIEGEILPYDLETGDSPYTVSTGAVEQLEAADWNENIQYVLLDIDSPGGAVTASEEIVAAIKHVNKPVAAMIRGQGASGAYWIAAGADTIFAYPTADLGSIAVNGSYLDYSKKNTEEGITFNDLSSGKFKNMLDPDKPLTAEERANAMEMILHSHNLIVADIANLRNLQIDKVKAVADGRLLHPEQAKEAGLIDSIGTKYDVLDFIAGQIGEEPELCELDFSEYDGWRLP